jgi:hypothetical protein
MVQIAGACLFCSAQAQRALHDVSGVSLAQNLAVMTYLVFHLLLTWEAHKAQPSRLTKQGLKVFCTWFVGTFFIVIAILLNGTYTWTLQDTVIASAAIGVALVVVSISSLQSLPIADPAVRSFLAIAFKSVPQVLLAWKIMVEGGSGIPGLSVAVGHATIILRLAHISFMVKEAGWERNRSWLAISETANELSWVVATIAWLSH